VTDRLAEIKARWRVVRDEKDETPVALDLQIDGQAKFDVGWLVGEVERLQRFEAMWEDCVKHRDQAEKRARRLQDMVTHVAETVLPNEDGDL
jgi:hypothetical protein